MESTVFEDTDPSSEVFSDSLLELLKKGEDKLQLHVEFRNSKEPVKGTLTGPYRDEYLIHLSGRRVAKGLYDEFFINLSEEDAREFARKRGLKDENTGVLVACYARNVKSISVLGEGKPRLLYKRN
jgi:hypothetical protein